MKTLYNFFTDKPHSLNGRRTRSGRTDDQGTPNTALHAAGCRGKPPRPKSGTFNAPPLESARQLGPEPITMLETHASPEWLHWENVINGEVDGKIARGVWQLVDFPGGKAVLGTTMVFKQKLDQYGRIEKHKCRLETQGFLSMKRVHYTESSSSTPQQGSIRVFIQQT